MTLERVWSPQILSRMMADFAPAVAKYEPWNSELSRFATLNDLAIAIPRFFPLIDRFRVVKLLNL